MTTPEPMSEFGPQSEDLSAVPVYVPKRYRSGPLVGAGRWVPIYAPITEPTPVGFLVTDDQDLLAFVPHPDTDGQHSATVQTVIRDALLGAAAQETPVSEVFDAWAQRDSVALAAGPVSSGDLRQIAP